MDRRRDRAWTMSDFPIRKGGTTQCDTKAISGKYLLNKALSPGANEILLLQGMSADKRRAIATVSHFVNMEQITDKAGVERVVLDQSLSGSSLTSHTTRTLDWKEREHDDGIFGHVTEKSRRIPAAQITDEFLNKGWTEDTLRDGIILTDTQSTPGKGNVAWRIVQTWGFAKVDGKRRYVRNTTYTASDKQAHARIVYDYLGPI